MRPSEVLRALSSSFQMPTEIGFGAFRMFVQHARRHLGHAVDVGLVLQLLAQIGERLDHLVELAGEHADLVAPLRQGVVDQLEVAGRAELGDVPRQRADRLGDDAVDDVEQDEQNHDRGHRALDGIFLDGLVGGREMVRQVPRHHRRPRSARHWSSRRSWAGR